MDEQVGLNRKDQSRPKNVASGSGAGEQEVVVEEVTE